MKSIFVLFLVLQSATAMAVGLPKKALVVTSLDQPAQTIEFPQIDLNQLKKVSASANYYEVGEGKTITIGAINYKLDPIMQVTPKTEGAGLTAENITNITYRLYSTEINAIVGRVLVDMTTGQVTVVKSNSQGKVTETY